MKTERKSKRAGIASNPLISCQATCTWQCLGNKKEFVLYLSVACYHRGNSGQELKQRPWRNAASHGLLILLFYTTYCSGVALPMFLAKKSPTDLPMGQCARETSTEVSSSQGLGGVGLHPTRGYKLLQTNHHSAKLAAS